MQFSCDVEALKAIHTSNNLTSSFDLDLNMMSSEGASFNVKSKNLCEGLRGGELGILKLVV